MVPLFGSFEPLKDVTIPGIVKHLALEKNKFCHSPPKCKWQLERV
jgi:hypothetical protein